MGQSAGRDEDLLLCASDFLWARLSNARPCQVLGSAVFAGAGFPWKAVRSWLFSVFSGWELGELFSGSGALVQPLVEDLE